MSGNTILCKRDTLPLVDGGTVVVVGAGSSGLAAARLLAAVGQKVRLVDRNPLSRQVADLATSMGWESATGPHVSEQFAGAALVVVSPGVPLPKVIPGITAAQVPLVIGEVELGAWFLTEPVIAVTGTSGKTTTVSLVAAMLAEAGKKVFLGGNIGSPLCDYILRGERADVVVLELSSFQLQLCRSLRPHVAVVLNLTENHLDQHTDMEEYKQAKLRIFANQTPDDYAIIPEGLREEYERSGALAPCFFPSATRHWECGFLRGEHNRKNAEVAYLASRYFGVTLAQACKVAKEFKSIPHRLEQVAQKGGVTFVNDSKSTTVESLAAALQSFPGDVILLAGGKYKGGDLASLVPLLRDKVKHVVLYGGSREIFERAWETSVPCLWRNTLAEALPAAYDLAHGSGVVLLSPATSSYDQYANYLERGEHFCRIVRSLV